MSTLDVHVQKCTQCRWEISLSGEDAEERGLVSWMAHVAALHPDRYRAARDAVQERWSRLRAEEAEAQGRQKCAEGRHDWFYEGDEMSVCLRCGDCYDAKEDAQTSEDTSTPPSEGETPDVVIGRMIQGVADGFAPVLQQLSSLVSAWLAPHPDDREALRKKLGDEG